MKRFIAKIYEITPDSWIDNFRGKSRFRTFKKLLLYKNGNYKIIKTHIRKNYCDIQVSFSFYAPIQIAAKAKKRGIENRLLRNSFELLSKIKSKSNLTILDVGANYGFLTLVWGHAFSRKNGIVYCFEPSPTVSSVTEKTIRANPLNNIQLFKKAVGNKNGEIEIYDAITTSNVQKISGSKPVKVEMVTLDQFAIDEQLNDVDLIKIDVDGLEYDVLQGSRNIIERHKPICIVETNNDERILELFKSLGYIILDMELKEITENIDIPGNIFCVSRKDYNNKP